MNDPTRRTIYRDKPGATLKLGRNTRGWRRALVENRGVPRIRGILLVCAGTLGCGTTVIGDRSSPANAGSTGTEGGSTLIVSGSQATGGTSLMVSSSTPNATGGAGPVSATGGFPATGGIQGTALAVRSVAAGQLGACAVLKGGGVACWGNGELTPVAVNSITNAISVAAAGPRCALLDDGTVRCWGSNDLGQLGNGTTLGSDVPVAVTGINSAAAISTGWSFGCAIVDGTVQCWGAGAGNWTSPKLAMSNSLLPVPVGGLSGVIGLSSDAMYNCVILGDRSIQCWGMDGAILHQSVTTFSTEPFTLAGSSNVSLIANGADHLCAILDTGNVRCWMQDTSHGTQMPVDIAGVSTAVAISSSEEHNCVVLQNGEIQCWGLNDNGQLGNGVTSWGSTVSPSYDAVTVIGITDAVAVAAGFRYTCAVLKDGRVQCWGLNAEGQLGNGTTVNSLVPTTVNGL